MALGLAAILCLANGFALASLCWPRGPFEPTSRNSGEKWGTPDLLLKASITVPFGLAIFSVIFFLAQIAGISRLLAVDLVTLAGLVAGLMLRRSRAGSGPVNAGLQWVLLKKQFLPISPTSAAKASIEDKPVIAALKRSATQNQAHRVFRQPGKLSSLATPKISPSAWLGHTVTAVFVASVCAALYSAVLRMLAHPHGNGWDAFAIWNLHARFLFLGERFGGEHWRDGYSTLIAWSHPDYPLLLPGAIAHFWSCFGRDDPAVPAIIGLVFTFSTVGLLYAALSMLRGRMCAMLGGMALLSTPSFIDLGTWQYADVPLAFFFLATVAFLCLHDERERDDSHSAGFLALGGLSAGFAAWTKNEGLLFLCAIVCALVWSVRRGRQRNSSSDTGAHSLVPLLVAMVPMVVVIVYFKRFVAPPGNLFSDPVTMLHKVLDPARYWAVIQSYVRELFRFGQWLVVPGTLLLPGLYLAMRKRKEDRLRHGTGFRASVAALALTLAGYFAIYLITPLDIYWHLRFSLDRLFLQVWPSAIFLVFLSIDESLSLSKASQEPQAQSSPNLSSPN
jgi:hypothetical protein